MTQHPAFSIVLVACIAAFQGCTDGQPQPAGGGPGSHDPSVDPSEGDETPTTTNSGDTSTSSDGPLPTSSVDSADTTSTADPTATADTVTATTDPPSICGDGVADPDETCDDGEANSDNAFCTEQCQVNVCGDGHKFTDVELCDQGLENSDQYPSFCGSDCTPGSFCGDGLLQKSAGEQCDDGPSNGMNDTGTSCDSVCHLVGLRAFITAEAFTGDLNGPEGADDKCQLAAFTAGLPAPESFHAVLSTAALSANDRLTPLIDELLPYILPGGQQIATSYPALMTTGPGDTGINVTEHGEQLIDVYVATNTTPLGDSASADHDCAGWTSADKNLDALVGYNALSATDLSLPTWKEEGWWIKKKLWTCDSPWFHLYCLAF